MSKYPKTVGRGDPQSAEDDLTHYMESTSRLRAEREALRQNAIQNGEQAQKWYKRAEAAEATMREVAQQMHNLRGPAREATVHEWADRLDPPPVVDTPSA